MITVEAVQARRDALAALEQQAVQRAAALERELQLQRRDIDAIRGGLQELDRLLESPEAGLQLLLAAPAMP